MAAMAMVLPALEKTVVIPQLCETSAAGVLGEQDWGADLLAGGSS